MRRLSILLLFIVIGSLAFGKDHVEVFGILSDFDTEKPAEGILAVYDLTDSTIYFTEHINEQGTFKVKLPYDSAFSLIFTGDNVVG
ncbi:MAG: hypothetical protein WAR83_09850 [Flavobacteriales bacterium]